MKYTIPFDDIVTSAVADTYKTMASVKVPDVAGRRVRICSYKVGSSADIPGDKSISVQLKRIADVSVGTPGTSTPAAPALLDPNGPATNMSGAIDYTVEPTTYEAQAVHQNSGTLRSGVEQFFDDARGESPTAIRDQFIGLLVAPRDATALNLSGEIVIEEF